MKLEPIDKTFLEQKYIQECLAPTKIAELLGCSAYYVRSYLKKYGLNRRYREDLSNTQIGKYFVTTYSHHVRNTAHWHCVCSCGRKRVMRGSAIKINANHACTCTIKHPSYEGIAGGYFGTIKTNARRKQLEFSISIEFAWELFQKQNARCALTGVEIFLPKKFREFYTASLDRIDSSKGYTVGNVQWVYRYVNELKSDFPQDELFSLVKMIYEHNNLSDFPEKQISANNSARSVVT